MMFSIAILLGSIPFLCGLLWRKQYGPIIIPAKLKIFCSIVVLASTVGLWHETGRFIAALEIQHWPSTSGQIITSQIAGNRGRYPRVTFRYIIRGQSYEATTDYQTPSFGSKKNKYEAARSVVEEFSAGTPVTVFYDPNNPANARLNHILPWDIFGKLGFSGCLYIGCLFFLAASFSHSSSLKIRGKFRQALTSVWS